MVTHSRDEAYELCETLAILERGRLIGIGAHEADVPRPRTRVGRGADRLQKYCHSRKAGGSSGAHSGGA